MNRKDFLDILRDYLKDNFNELKVNDILRDYEEIFLKGELEGQSDEQIIGKLGSPKNIANEFICAKREKQNTSKCNSGFNDKSMRFLKSIGQAFVKLGKKISNKSSNLLDGSSIVSGKISERFVKNSLIIISCLLVIPALPIFAIMVLGGITLIGFTVGNIIGFIGAVMLFSLNVSTGIFTLFLSIAWTGITIIAWLLYTIIFNFIRRTIINYVSWVKSRKMYLKVKKNNNEIVYNKDIVSNEGSELHE